MIYSLRDLLGNVERCYTFREKDYDIKVWAGLSNPFARSINNQRCYEFFGLFRYIVRENKIPRVVSAVIKNRKILAYAMLAEESRNMRWFEVDPQDYVPLGYLGYYTVPEYRKQGYASVALKKMDDVISDLLPESDLKYCYFGQANVYLHQNRVCKQAVLPFSKLEDLPVDSIMLAA
jgi:hypothetical protein